MANEDHDQRDRTGHLQHHECVPRREFEFAMRVLNYKQDLIRFRLRALHRKTNQILRVLKTLRPPSPTPSNPVRAIVRFGAPTKE